MNLNNFSKPTVTNYSLHNNLLSSVSTARTTDQIPSVLTNEITPTPPCANQKSTGRCWIFAAVNMLRRELITQKKIPESFEFSQSYVFFYDKFERMNYNLKLVEDLKQQNHNFDSRIIQHILKEPFGDGGQWVMFTNIANKYGLVPKDVYPESVHSSNSRGVNKVLSVMFRTYVKDIYTNKPYSRQTSLQKTYETLIRFFGEPPQEIIWNYKSNNTVNTYTGTPLEFMKTYCNIDFNNYVSLTHDPRNEYDNLYGVEGLCCKLL